MPVTDFFGRICLTIFVLSIAILSAEAASQASKETVLATAKGVGGILAFFVTLTAIVAIWEDRFKN
ncbi:MAG TPA: hypothetical protein VN231_06140 [Allosphingosinicella sp.]|nr:hypothetical protein [Allosphingosinicella sp.]